MIWSIIPESVIFANENENSIADQVEYQGRKLLVGKEISGKREIISLLSTDPADFLNANFAPGALIDVR